MPDMDDVTRLEPAALRRSCDPAGFTFETTADLPDSPLLSDRRGRWTPSSSASRSGRRGTTCLRSGRPASASTPLCDGSSITRPRPSPAADWCYVHNFEQPHIPGRSRFRPGTGRQFRDDMARLVEDLRPRSRPPSTARVSERHREIDASSAQQQTGHRRFARAGHPASESPCFRSPPVSAWRPCAKERSSARRVRAACRPRSGAPPGGDRPDRSRGGADSSAGSPLAARGAGPVPS